MPIFYPDSLQHNNSTKYLVDITEVRGNTYPLGLLSDTGSIPEDKRKIGQIVYISSSRQYFGFFGQTTSSAEWNSVNNWRTLSTFSGSYTGSFSGSFIGDVIGTASMAVSASHVINLDLSRIASFETTASVSDGSDAFVLIQNTSTIYSIDKLSTINHTPNQRIKGYLAYIKDSYTIELDISYGDISSTFKKFDILYINDSTYDNVYGVICVEIDICSFNGTYTVVEVSNTYALVPGGRCIIGNLSKTDTWGGDKEIPTIYSKASGLESNVLNDYSFVQGNGLISVSKYQTVLGNWNVYDTSSLLVIGDGTNHYSRHNLATFNTDIIKFNAPVSASEFIGPLLRTEDSSVNYVPKFIGDKLFTTSSIYDNGTNIGIGTEDITERLTVNGSILSRTSKPLFIMYDTDLDVNALYLGANFDIYGGLVSYGTFAINRNPTNGVFYNISRSAAQINLESSTNSATIRFYTSNNNNVTPELAMTVTPRRNVIIGPSSVGSEAGARLHARGEGSTSSTFSFLVENSNAERILAIRDDGQIVINKPTGSNVTLDISGSVLTTGSLTVSGSYNDSTYQGTLNVSGVLAATNGIWINNYSGYRYPFWIYDPLNSYPSSGNFPIYYDNQTKRLFVIKPSGSSASPHGGYNMFMYANHNGDAGGIVFKNYSPGASAGIGIKFTNDANVDVFQNYIGNSASTYGSNTVFIRNLASGSMRFVSDANRPFTFGTDLFGSSTFLDLNLTSSRFTLKGVTTNSSSFTAQFHDSSGISNTLVIRDDRRIGILKSTPNTAFDVNGNVLITGSLNVSQVITGSINAFGPTGSIQINGAGIISGSSTLTWDIINSRLNIIGNGTGSILLSGSAGSSITLIRPTSGLSGFVRYIGTTMEIGTVGADPLNLLTGNVVRLSLGSTGLIGAGLAEVTPSAQFHLRGAGATAATTTLLVQNSSPVNLLSILDNGQYIYNTPTMSLAASQSAYDIRLNVSQSNTVGAQVYGINITPTFFATTASQTETAFRVNATFTGSSAASGMTNIIADFGATNVGSQLTVTDVVSGSIYMVNDVSGLPILEATSDWVFRIYDFPRIVFEKSGSNITISGSLNISGSTILSPGSTFVMPLYPTTGSNLLTGSAFWSGSFLYIWNGIKYMSSSFS